MGYEIKLIIGRLTGMCQDFSKVIDSNGENWYSCYNDDEASGYIGYKHGENKISLPNPSHKAAYLVEFARIDLCKPGYDSEILKLKSDTKGLMSCYIYHNSQNNGDPVDCYGDFLHAFKINDIIQALEVDSSETLYKRFDIALDLLRSINFRYNEDIFVTMWGY